MAQSLNRKVNRGKLIVVPSMLGNIFYRKLSRGGFAATKSPGSHNAPIYGNTYSRKQLSII